MGAVKDVLGIVFISVFTPRQHLLRVSTVNLLREEFINTVAVAAQSIPFRQL